MFAKAALLCLACGCSATPVPDGRGLEVLVKADSLGADTLDSVRALELHAGSEVRQFAAPQFAQRRLRLQLRPSAPDGTLAIAVTALDGLGLPVAAGQANVELGKGWSSVEVELIPGGVDLGSIDLGQRDLAAASDLAESADLAESPDLQSPDLQTPDLQSPDLQKPDLQKPDLQTPDLLLPDLAVIHDLSHGDLAGADLATVQIPLQVSPLSATVFVGGTLALKADRPVTWEVPLGGTLDARSVFHPPLVPDVYTLHATAASGLTADVTVTVVAGSLDLIAGTAGGRGNIDGIGNAARFDHPSQAVSDGNGHLFLVDDHNNNVRRIDLSSGQVTTLAGSGSSFSQEGFGPQAGFAGPVGIALEGSDLYVSEPGAGVIKKVDTVLGTATNFIGKPYEFAMIDDIGTDARVAEPSWMGTDGQGHIYFADGFVVRRFTVATGLVETLADLGFGAPSGFAPGTSAGTVLLANGVRHILQLFDPAGPTYSLFAGQPANEGSSDSPIQFNQPESLAHVGSFLYVADHVNATIRSIDISGGTAGTCTTLAGLPGVYGNVDGVGSAARFAAPRGLTHFNNSLYITDYEVGVVRQLALADNSVSTFAGRPQINGYQDGTGSGVIFDGPEGMAFDGTNVWVCDRRTIRKVVLATGVTTTEVGSIGQAGMVDDVGTDARMFGCADIVFVPPSSLYFSDTGNNNLRKIALPGLQVTTLAGWDGTGFEGAIPIDGVGNQARFNQPEQLAYDNGFLYVADSSARLVRRVEVDTASVDTLAGLNGWDDNLDGVGSGAHFSRYTGIAVEGGQLYIADTEHFTLRRLDPLTRQVSTVAGVPGLSGSDDGFGFEARFLGPHHIVGDGSGHLFISDGNLIRRYDVASGGVSTVVGSASSVGVRFGALPGSLSKGWGLARVGANDFLLGDYNEHVILRLHP